MLDRIKIRNKVYNKLHDDNSGNGAYTIEYINDLIEQAFINFCIQTETIKFKNHIKNEKYCFGLFSISISPKNIQITKNGNYLKVSSPCEVIWVYAHYEIVKESHGELNFEYIKYTEGLISLHENAIIYNILFLLFTEEQKQQQANHYYREFDRAYNHIRNSKFNSVKEG